MPKPGPRTTNRYSDQFKATAVRLSQVRGAAVQDVAASAAGGHSLDLQGHLGRRGRAERARWTSPAERTE